ncbi:hypothetical protein RvY_18701 [Ramazzottius varieornatus]|uniref:3-hydroxyacyl-CoA dehydrogenase n=1 Tax=Ramazzottius varieornatus TaxID=947166 RepID=A0A1D1WAV3_RAMVA|nr:hypothetical protein RvY_18701 [Ramazzottius varieornatus]
MLSSTVHQVVQRSYSVQKSVIRDVMVVGSGLMGTGIAQVVAAAGMNVSLVDRSTKMVDDAKSHMEKSLTKHAQKQFPDEKDKQKTFVEETLSRVRAYNDPCIPAGQADLVIEAIVEHLPSKKDLFHKIDKVAANHTIFTTNTSSLSVGAMAEATERKDRFGGLHFFSPVPVMKLVEVVRIDQTSDDTLESLMSFVKAINKVPIKCKDTRGFIVNRLLIPYTMEAIRMLERGDAAAKDIDTAMKLGAGYKVGPIELTDLTGIDLAKHIGDAWSRDHPNDPVFKPILLIDKMVAEGRIGKKSGKGFYEYADALRGDERQAIATQQAEEKAHA